MTSSCDGGVLVVLNDRRHLPHQGRLREAYFTALFKGQVPMGCGSFRLYLAGLCGDNRHGNPAMWATINVSTVKGVTKLEFVEIN